MGRIIEKLNQVFGNRPDTQQAPTSAWAEAFDMGTYQEGKKAVYTEAFWLAPPYGRPRDIDFGRLEALEESVWVRMCVQHIVNGVSKARWNVSPETDGEDVSPVEIDEAEEFFKSKAWSNSLRQVFRTMLPDLLHYDAGVMLKAFPTKAYDSNWVLKENNSYKPVELYARDGRSFMIDTDLTGTLKGYWQYSWFNPQGQPTFFRPEELLYIQLNPRSRSPYGISNLEIIEQEVNYLQDSTQAQTRYWRNGLFMGGVIKMPEVKNLDELKRYQKYFDSKLKGAENYNKWLVLNGDTDIQTTPFTPQQMQWLDSQKWFAKLVFSVFRVTPSELGFTEDLNRATGVQQMQIYKSEAILPILELLEEIINREIVWKHFSENIRFNFVKEQDLDDKKKQADIDNIMLNNGVVSINEIRDRLGFEKWEEEQYDKPLLGQLEQQPEGEEEEPLFNPEEDNEQDEQEKAANIGAASGEAGFVPVPEAYAGMKSPVKIKRNEKKIKREMDRLYASLDEEAKKQIKRYYDELITEDNR